MHSSTRTNMQSCPSTHPGLNTFIQTNAKQTNKRNPSQTRITSCSRHAFPTCNINNNNCIQRRNFRFYTISSLRREQSPRCMLKWPRRNRVQITCNTLSAYHVQHVMLRATWYEGTAQLLNLTELKSHIFELYLTG